MRFGSTKCPNELALECADSHLAPVVRETVHHARLCHNEPVCLRMCLYVFFLKATCGAWACPHLMMTGLAEPRTSTGYEAQLDVYSQPMALLDFRSRKDIVRFGRSTPVLRERNSERISLRHAVSATHDSERSSVQKTVESPQLQFLPDGLSMCYGRRLRRDVG